ncbi:MAG: permease-like cell division protein FtsX [Candidatus Saccharibacteria bacterium]|nr:permease-like cell division protein FtsX [Candidatus Saccharibacteria bacterium]
MTDENKVVDQKPKTKKSLKGVAKAKLKTMKRSSTKHPVREKSRIVKYGAIGFTRNIWLSTAATAVMTLTLFILFLTVVASIILSNTADAMREKIDITVYFKPGTSETTLKTLEEKMAADSNVKSVETATSQEEYDKFISEHQDNKELLEVVKEDDMREIMISQMQSTMRIKAHNVDDLSSIKNLVENEKIFQDNLDSKKAPTYNVNQIEIATITTWAKIARTSGIILGIVFLVISVLIIFSTIRLSIFSRREEIYMMKLVGASKGFTRGPFIVEAEICGVIAAILAATISYFFFNLLAPRLSNYGINTDSIANVLASNKLILIYIAFIIAGVAIGSVSARLAVKKYLNKA